MPAERRPLARSVQDIGCRETRRLYICSAGLYENLIYNFSKTSLRGLSTISTGAYTGETEPITGSGGCYDDIQVALFSSFD
jgi:hypothetical protein